MLSMSNIYGPFIVREILAISYIWDKRMGINLMVSQSLLFVIKSIGVCKEDYGQFLESVTMKLGDFCKWIQTDMYGHCYW